MIQSESFDGAELHIPTPHFNSTSCLCSNKPTGGVVDDDRPPNLDEDSDTEPSAGTKRAWKDPNRYKKNKSSATLNRSVDWWKREQGHLGCISTLSPATALNSFNHSSPDLATQGRSVNSTRRRQLDVRIVDDDHASPLVHNLLRLVKITP